MSAGRCVPFNGATTVQLEPFYKEIIFKLKTSLLAHALGRFLIVLFFTASEDT
jgi:hypothetical protein